MEGYSAGLLVYRNPHENKKKYHLILPSVSLPDCLAGSTREGVGIGVIKVSGELLASPTFANGRDDWLLSSILGKRSR